jgi:uncharacterized DUF497 family protein
MEISFESDKDAADIAKHALSLALARDLEWDTLQWKEDTRRCYGETRMAGYAFMGSVFMVLSMSFVVMCSDLSACARPISER